MKWVFKLPDWAQALPWWRRRSGRTRSLLLLLLSILLLTAAIGQQFYDQPELAEGTIAPETLLAQRDAVVEDKQTTQEWQRAAISGTTPVLRLNQLSNRTMTEALNQALTRGQDLRSQLRSSAGPPPDVLSTTSQQRIWQASPGAWAELRAQLQDPSPRPLTPPQSSPSPTTTSPPDPLQTVLQELLRYRRQVPAATFSQLLQQLDQRRSRYQAVQTQLQQALPQSADRLYDMATLGLAEAEWEELRSGSHLALQRILLQGIAPGMPEGLREPVIKLHVGLTVPPAGQAVAQRLLAQVLQPNLEPDPEQTKLLADQAAKRVTPAVASIRKGEPIIEAGKVISRRQFVLLDHFKASKRSPNWQGLLRLAGLITLLLAGFTAIRQQLRLRLRRRDHCLILLLAVASPLLLPVPFLGGGSNLVAVGLLGASFYGPWIGTMTVAGLALALPFGLEVDPNTFIPGISGGLVAGLLAGRSRSREELALMSLGVGLTQGCMHLIVALILANTNGAIWYLLLRNASQSALAGLAWSILALGLSPYLERLFDLVTPIRLAELSNPNRPLLRDLAAKTPGTFQHTLLVATLAEAAARSLHCDVELVRAGTLYHDIGKMHDPQGFIENQMGGTNKHDLINDPWQSAAIIKKHVTEGLVMARRNGLPNQLQAFIPEHQGTMFISYFYHQAKVLTERHPDRYTLREEDFRYDGPIPQSRETGIVMLADSCEAALRSLKSASTQEALSMVKKVMRARWQENQLTDSGLSREDLNQIAEVFVHIWQQFHHQRIPYPSARD